MPKYDATLKRVLQKWGTLLVSELAGDHIVRWRQTEFPQITTQYADLLAETGAGKLWHLELQSTNDQRMAERMLEYSTRVNAIHGSYPKQCVLYVGAEPMRMRAEIRDEDLWFRDRLVDVRELDGERLLESGAVGDKIMSILTNLRSSQEAVGRILEAVGALEEAEREEALEACLLLAGLRELEETLNREARKMPVFDDILENKVLGREFRRGLEQGLEQGMERGLEQGHLAGELAILRRQIEKRFGSVPPPLAERLAHLSPAEIENLSVRILDAASIDELLA